ncbi:putative glutamine amidotransferase [Candidatus Kryptobacter tengchongensis]|uniref:Glutamine amidotransferase n=1 Tax=Kryptobacter tengchongensis TaxID=1643429 RepID=A0A916PI38_KRYT1|nr:gamma-glutamyl-gamma-aminobutyrate hydrolase family protein [Candidatus Kryptobacter tengchongensis]CUS99246.1 putative glutamine amidotransferase [Candidatus Kryptobacter tengchongensis]CUU03438.1 putative glutamine amidotransferase [Candidatus Kryptobacter tengchongensis]CUU10920.1 putative glutamine amidotransferase [Candidatus Kryptobacter tengchongensis]
MIKVGVSYCDSNLENYINWLRRASVEVEPVILSYKELNSDDLKKCDALLLTGGDDVHPEFYGESEREGDKYNRDRDWFEFKLLDIAFSKDLPILGICRGLQLTNVYLRGSLVFDIQTVIGTNHRKDENTGDDRLHNIFVFDDSKLFKIVGEREGIVNSSHHQSADRIGENLRISAKCDDGVIEGLEWVGDDRFVLLVQWHPERMKNFESVFSRNLLEAFINSIIQK